ncbi:hypothetical protein Tco_0241928 [Tanacetum coccineum]
MSSFLTILYTLGNAQKFNIEEATIKTDVIRNQTHFWAKTEDPLWHKMISWHGLVAIFYLSVSKDGHQLCVYLCACFHEDPKTSHLEAVKRTFRYIKGTTHLGLWYPKGVETILYADSDHAGDYADYKSTSDSRFSSLSKANSILQMEPAEPAAESPRPASPTYQNLSTPTDYHMAPPSSPIVSPPLYLIASPGISPSHLLNTPKTTHPPLTKTPPPAPSQPSKLNSPLAINLEPVELIFSTPPTSPYLFFDSLEDLPP